MRVLVGCEFSQVVTRAFRDKGHEAYSCDLLPTEGNPDWHIQDDVLNHLDDIWDLAIFHPPCTYLTNAGVRHLYEHIVSRNGKHAAVYGFARWVEMRKAAEFFRQLLNADIPKICVENPIPHRYAVAEIGRKYDQLLQPWQFGHPETKATCLWLKNLPPLKPTNIVDGREARIHKMPPSKDRWKNRSRTYIGIANAMSEQWG
ncbi:MAG: hypothetical protein V1854_02715 [Methanobacteriota archaeon]